MIVHLVDIAQDAGVRLPAPAVRCRRCTLSSSRAGPARPAAAVDYLLGERDAAGELREGVDVLRGDPEMVAAVADTLEFEHKYTAGVIAWAPEDRPTDAQIESPSSTSSSRRPGRGLSPTATRGRRSSTASAAAGCMCMCSPPAVTWRRAAASTSRRPAGSRPLTRCATASTTSTAGAGPTTRRAPGRSNPATAPTSKRQRCGPDLSTKPSRAS